MIQSKVVDIKNRMGGFTVVELVVVIAVIGILTAIGTFAYTTIRNNAKDDTRKANVTVIADQLEAYYSRKGEYPACSSLTGNPATVASTVLPGIDISVFKAPNASASTTNSIVCGNITGNQDVFAFVPDSSGIGWTLRYLSETDGQMKEIKSRRSGTAVVVQPPAPEPPVEDYNNPTLPSSGFTLSEIQNICSSTNNRPAGYTYTTTPLSGTFNGTSGNDIFYVSGGSVTINGSSGDDIFCLNGASGTMNGGDGNDIISITSGSTTTNAGNGNDILISYGGSGNLSGSNDDDTFYIVNGTPSVNGGSGFDRMRKYNANTITVSSIEENF